MCMRASLCVCVSSQTVKGDFGNRLCSRCQCQMGSANLTDCQGVQISETSTPLRNWDHRLRQIQFSAFGASESLLIIRSVFRESNIRALRCHKQKRWKHWRKRDLSAIKSHEYSECIRLVHTNDQHGCERKEDLIVWPSQTGRDEVSKKTRG